MRVFYLAGYAECICGLIVMVPQGWERICQLQPDKLNEVSDWLSGFHKILEERFERLDQVLANNP